jgi:hemerythrin
VESSWDESMATGNEMIDEQHQGVVKLLDELRASHLSSEARGRRALEDLMDFTLTHFVAEEVLMEQVAYPADRAAHMIEHHNEFKAYARLRVIEFRTGNMAAVLPLAAYLHDWLTVHEFGVDRLLADWIRARQPSSSGA